MKLKENFKIPNSIGIKSIADYGIEIQALSELPELYELIKNRNFDYFILGEGTNLIPPNHFKGLVISLKFNDIEKQNNIIRVGSSVNWHDLVLYSIDRGYYGFENLSFIPGSVGAAPIQNIGAYGSDVKDLISMVYYFDLENGTFNSFTNDECKFSYRDSIFKGSNKIITHIDFLINLNGELNLNYKSLSQKVDLLINSGETIDLSSTSRLVTDIRKEVLPDHNIEPNAGSFFKNPIVDKSKINQTTHNLDELVIWEIDSKFVKVGAARLIQLIKDQLPVFDNVFLSSKHNLVITTNMKADQSEVLEFAEIIKLKVYETFNIKLEIEPRVIS